jgi:putative DNA primase/helicase
MANNGDSDNQMYQYIGNRWIKRIQTDKFQDLLDSKTSLLVFTNGTYDLKTGMLRQSLPSDYNTLMINYDYQEFIDDNQYIKEINDYFTQLFPDEERRNYAWTLMASYLAGRDARTDEHFDIWYDGKGKSTLSHLLKMVFSDYCAHIPYDVLTSSMMSSKANPHLFDLRGKRLLFVDDGSTNSFDPNVFKGLMGSDMMTYRTPYDDPITFRPQFHLVALMNINPLTVENTGFQRRARVIPFSSGFAIDPQIREKMKHWVQPMCYLLLKKYRSMMAI